MKKIIKIIPQEKITEDFLNLKPASEFLPEWYRKTSSNISETFTELKVDIPVATNSTYKKCTPFYDAMTAGYIVFLNADIEVTRKDNNDPYIMWRTQRKIISEHDLEQWKGFPCPSGYSLYVYKWHNQFIFKTPKNYSLLFTHPINRTDLPFQTITGLVDTDKYELPVHFPFFIKNDFVGIIEKGTPISQVIPVKRDSWARDIEDYNENDSYFRSEKYHSTIHRSYKKNYWTRKEYK